MIVTKKWSIRKPRIPNFFTVMWDDFIITSGSSSIVNERYEKYEIRKKIGETRNTRISYFVFFVYDERRPLIWLIYFHGSTWF